ncbi:unnamed protein product, partial [Ectocarpus sp. 12 AP-2014]
TLPASGSPRRGERAGGAPCGGRRRRRPRRAQGWRSTGLARCWCASTTSTHRRTPVPGPRAASAVRGDPGSPARGARLLRRPAVVGWMSRSGRMRWDSAGPACTSMPSSPGTETAPAPPRTCTGSSRPRSPPAPSSSAPAFRGRCRTSSSSTEETTAPGARLG